MNDTAHLCLADGTQFEGRALGAAGRTVGEVVFTTGMTGYQEVLTDPSYTGQLVTMTAPQIGNTGCNPQDEESVTGRPHVAGFIVRDASERASNWRSEETLSAYLTRHGITAISGIDTRRLTKHLRDGGAQNGAIGTDAPETLVGVAQDAPPMTGQDLVARVTPNRPYEWTEGSGDWCPDKLRDYADEGTTRHVVVMDFGIKRNILRYLVDSGCRVTAVPARTSASDIMALQPDGIFLSSGPGDPAAVTYAIETIRQLLGQRPVFGICLGHQLLAIAAGAKTYKLKFGHRGINQPVKDLSTGRVEITTQNHGFCVDLDSLVGKAHSTHINLNDGTSEGIEIPDSDAFSVQFHPEAACGPHDALHLFKRFTDRIDRVRSS